jgi:predicted permease
MAAPVINQIFILFLLLFVGFFARRIKKIHGDINAQLSDLAMLFLLPCTVISSFLHNDPREILSGGAQVFVVAFCTHLGSILLGALLFRKTEERAKKVLWFLTVFSNSAFMGYPIMESMYGKIGILYGSFYSVNFSLFLWTFGYALYSGQRSVKVLRNVLTSPGLIAIALGMLLAFFSIKLPSALVKTIDILGGMTTPLCMIVIGSTLAEIKLRDVFSGLHIYVGAFIRLIFLPLATLFVLKAIGVGGIPLGISVIAVAMPAGTTTVIFAKKFGGDAHLATRCVFFSTALSVVTIPFIMYMLA